MSRFARNRDRGQSGRTGPTQMSFGPPPPSVIFSGALAAWYRADSGITLATGVSQWNDLSPNGKNLTQGTGALQPSLNTSDAAYGNQATVQSTAATMFLASGAYVINQPLSLFVIGEFSTSGAVYVGSDTAGVGPQILDSAGNTAGNAGASVVDAVSHSTPKAFLFVANGASSFIGVSDWLTAGVTGPGGANATAGISLFAYTNGTFGTVGKVAEAVWVSRVVTTSDKTAMAAYIKTKYNMAIT